MFLDISSGTKHIGNGKFNPRRPMIRVAIVSSGVVA
jgi:hypothetical protein